MPRAVARMRAHQSLSIFIKADVSEFLKHYNTKRMHMGIKFKTPAKMLEIQSK
jgi:hypothetical protein